MAESLEDAIKKPKWGLRITIGFAVVFTVAGCGLAIALAGPQLIHCAAGWNIYDPRGWFSDAPPEGFKCMGLNEYGDFLAGTFAPLAFLWLVLAVFLQRAELTDQKNALLAQLNESKEHTEFYIRETAKKDLERLLKTVRVRLTYVEPRDRNTMDSDIAYLMACGHAKVSSITAAIRPNIQNDYERNRAGQNKREAAKLKPEIPSLRAIRDRLVPSEIAIYEACAIPELIEVLESVPEN